MSTDREAEVLARINRARAQLVATGELGTRIGGGRAPARSDVFKQAAAEIHAAEQARNRLLVELVGAADTVPLELARRLGLTGREAAHVVETARSGSRRMRAHVLGEPETAG
ncbi:hypothetical protein [Nocardia transvalensis]|uniref:hypothetical protein n=1 Tax=Nocardia transvalensis TaxID=37333 RepID=UPI00189531D1|nr:hypothetical protein [Nocardia transvalensis]MBF6333462.1 hypothetical protein [Nocardia transvalensis]